MSKIKHTMAAMTEAELLKRIKGRQSGVWRGYEYEAEWMDGDDEWWLTSDQFGPNTWTWKDVIWSRSLEKHLNRFYDNESNPGPKWYGVKQAEHDAIRLVA